MLCVTHNTEVDTNNNTKDRDTGEPFEGGEKPNSMAMAPFQHVQRLLLLWCFTLSTEALSSAGGRLRRRLRQQQPQLCARHWHPRTNAKPSRNERRNDVRFAWEHHRREASFIALQCTTIDDGQSIATTDTATATATPICAPSTWNDRINQLMEFKEEHGHMLVPKRYPPNPSLGNFVNKQRQHYRKHKNGISSSLTQQRIQQLSSIGFCWDASALSTKQKGVASSVPAAHVAIDSPLQQQRTHSIWWRRFGELEQFTQTSPLAKLSSQSSLGQWVYRQRREFMNRRRGEPCALQEDQIRALEDIDRNWWMSNRERQWETRFEQLKAYKEEHGNCLVPISHANQQLANWVSSQRKLYAKQFPRDGNRNGHVRSSTHLTAARIARLNELGFVWNHWEFHYDLNINRSEHFISTG